jgi:hypothetical protein
MSDDNFSWSKAMKNLSYSQIDDFIHTENVLELEEIPGITSKTADILRDNDILNSTNLVGKFLSIYDYKYDTQENSNEFYLWLGEIGMDTKYKDSITRLIIEKIYSILPGLIDISCFSE